MGLYNFTHSSLFDSISLYCVVVGHITQASIFTLLHKFDFEIFSQPLTHPTSDMKSNQMNETLKSLDFHIKFDVIVIYSL